MVYLIRKENKSHFEKMTKFNSYNPKMLMSDMVVQSKPFKIIKNRGLNDKSSYIEAWFNAWLYDKEETNVVFI